MCSSLTDHLISTTAAAATTHREAMDPPGVFQVGI